MTGTLTTQAAAEPVALATLLEQHVRAIASVEHNTATPAALEASARYIEATLAHHGYAVRRHEYTCDGQRVRNIAVSLAPPAPAPAPERVIIVGAHYDSAPGAPGANDNGSGVAALLALAERLKTARIAPGTELQLVFFVNEEPPHFMTECMGSRRHAQQIKAAGLPVEAVLILETIGYYTDAPNSQRYPAGLAALYPDTGNFLGFVSTLSSASLMRRALAAFRAATSFPAQGLAAPSIVEGVTLSDHTSYNRLGYPAIMLTDTAFMRYPHYHTAQDTPDKLNYSRLAQVVDGLTRVVGAMVAAPGPGAH